MSRSLRSEDSIRSQSKSSGKQKVIIIILSVILAIVLLAGGVYFLKIYVLDKLKSGNKTTICRTDDCLEAAEYFKTTMNLSADPCNDFFSYACGGWVQKYKHLLDSGHTRISVNGVGDIDAQSKLQELLSSSEVSSSNAVNQTKLFYQRCLNRQRSKEFAGIKRIVKDFGGFPMYNEETYDKQIPWYVRVAKTTRQFGIVTIFEDVLQGIIFNFKIDLVNGLILVQPGSYYGRRREGRYNETIKTSICNILKKSCSTIESERISKEIENMIQFYHQIKKIKDENVYDKRELGTTVQQFQEDFPELHMFEFLKELLNGSGSKIDLNTRLFVGNRYYWGNVSQLIKKTDPRVIDNLIGWSTFEVLKYTESPTTTLEAFKYLQADAMEYVSKDINNKCFEMTQYAFPFAVGRLYADKFFNNNLKSNVLALISDLKKAAIEIIKEKDWLSNNVKEEAIHKIILMDNNDVGYPIWLKLDKKLDRYYNLKKPLPESSVIEMYRMVYSFNMNDHLTKLDHPHNKDTAWYAMYPQSDNAFMDFENRMVLPVTKFVSPKFWPVTKALTYATQAGTIGHEMTHSIDSHGSSYDAHGNNRNWWDDNSKKAFDEKVQCVIDQFNDIVDSQAKERLNGKATKGENTADYGGWHLAYRAYLNSGTKDERLPGLEDLSDQKLFFIGAGMTFCGAYTDYQMKQDILTDHHAPNKYRVIMPNANMEEFPNIFNCPIGSEMNLPKKCVVW